MTIEQINKEAEETLLKHSKFVQSVEDWTLLQGKDLINFGEEFRAFMSLNVDFNAEQPEVYVRLSALDFAVKYSMESEVREELFWFKDHKNEVIYKGE